MRPPSSNDLIKFTEVYIPYPSGFKLMTCTIDPIFFIKK
jgi:hypothetical protein